MPSLLTYTTDLKSYKFGVPPASDRPGGGNSKQPYIKTPIPPQDQQIPGNDLAATDFFLRGGINAARDTADDLIRLGKYFTDFKSINGPLFVAKQNSLSSIAVRTQASGNGTNFGLNEGVYTPLSTLAQAGINFIGGHVDKQGINPIRGVTTYSDVSNIVIGAPNGEGNRLVDLYNTQVPHQGNEFTLDNPVTLYSYQGGPNSIIGATKTNINFATDNKGGPMLTGVATKDYQAGLRENPTELFQLPLGVSLQARSKFTSSPFFSIKETVKDTTNTKILTPNDEVLAIISAENGITWINTDGTPPTPKLQNPTELFIYPTGDDATSMYMFTTGEAVNSNLTSDDGISWRETLTNPYATGTKGTLATKVYQPRNNRTPNPVDEFIYPTGSTDYSTLLNTSVNSEVDNSNGKTWEYQDFQPSVYNPNTLDSSDKVKNPVNQNYATQTTEELNTSANVVSQNNTLTNTVDFRNPLRSRPGASKIMSLAPSYISANNKTIDGFDGSRIKYTSPGQRGKNLTSYTNGSGLGPIDKINSQRIYKSENADPEIIAGDLIPFIIGAIDQNNPNEKEFIHFRAYIDNFSDGYTANWESQKYMGRGEPFYKYGGFERKINLGFTVAAQSKEELLQQYKKLNFLASNLAPTYSKSGYMGGPLVTLTMGGWCSYLPGFIESLTLDVPEESSWEIGIDDVGELSTIGGGGASQLPHIVKVTGFTFTPIHTFRPEKQRNEFKQGPNGYKEIEFYGDEHYIHLAEPGTNVIAGSTLYNQFM